MRVLALLWKGFRTFWWPIIAIVLLAIAHISDLAAIKEWLNEGWDFWSQLKSWKVLGGSILVGVLVALPISIVIWFAVFFLRWMAPWNMDVRLAVRRAVRGYGRHLRDAVQDSLANLFTWGDDRKRVELVAASLDGLSDEEVIASHCEAGSRSRPLVFCNFQAYAHAVAKILDILPTLRCERPYPQVWTIFKRPVCDWYNTFPIEWEEGAKVIRGQVTYGWWEKYKSTIVSLKGRDSAVQFHRVVAHIPWPGSPKDPEAYYLYHPEPLFLGQAIAKALPLKGQVEWHPSIAALLESLDYEDKRDFQIYLIGKPTPNAANPGKDSLVVEHFQTSTHDGNNPGPTEGGVYVRYLQTQASLGERLRDYDDVFIVKFSRSSGFGVAFIDDEIRDINGLRYLARAELGPTEAGTSSTLFDLIAGAWAVAAKGFCVCQ